MAGIKKDSRINNMRAILFLAILTCFFSCKNGNRDMAFPDFEYQSVYFPYQYPFRTIVLGQDIFSTELDNLHQFEIMATTGGVYENREDIKVDFVVDTSLTDNLSFGSGGNTIKALPENYYEFLSDQIIIPKGNLSGGVKVQLKDDFFDDPKAIKNTYVLSLKLKEVENADTILSGVPRELVKDPDRIDANDWDILPKDYVLYGIKFINEWEGNYFREGVDQLKWHNQGMTIDTTIYRHQEFVVDNEVVKMNTTSLTGLNYPVVFKDKEGLNHDFTLKLKFSDKNEIAISGGTSNQTIQGEGTFIENGAEWGGEKHNLIILDYSIVSDEIEINSKDSLIMRDRGVSMETFTPFLK